MNDLISREAVIEMLHYNCDESCSAIIRDVENLSVADAVEVVRCKDCKHWRMTVSTGTYGECMCDDMETNVLYTMADDYCSYGERKED